ncbi:MAG TPA: hypothetical protein VKQ52_10515 [Puia sp.]|nr:hypothetical protein [Puia sp.]
MAEYFNSSEYAWSDLQVVLNGKVITGIRGIKHSMEQDLEEVYGAGVQPLAIQEGNMKYEGEITLLKMEADDLETAVLAAGYPSVLKAKGLSIVVHFENDEGYVNTKIVSKLKISKWEESMKQNDKFMEIAVPFKALSIQKVS